MNLGVCTPWLQLINALMELVAPFFRLLVKIWRFKIRSNSRFSVPVLNPSANLAEARTPWLAGLEFVPHNIAPAEAYWNSRSVNNLMQSRQMLAGEDYKFVNVFWTSMTLTCKRNVSRYNDLGWISWVSKLIIAFSAVFICSNNSLFSERTSIIIFMVLIPVFCGFLRKRITWSVSVNNASRISTVDVSIVVTSERRSLLFRSLAPPVRLLCWWFGLSFDDGIGGYYMSWFYTDWILGKAWITLQSQCSSINGSVWGR